MSPIAQAKTPQYTLAELRNVGLKRALDDEAGAVIQAAVKSLGSFGLKAVPLLVHVLKEKKGHARVLAAENLGRIGPDAKDAIPALQRAKGDLDRSLSKAASDALAVITKK